MKNILFFNIAIMFNNPHCLRNSQITFRSNRARCASWSALSWITFNTGLTFSIVILKYHVMRYIFFHFSNNKTNLFKLKVGSLFQRIHIYRYVYRKNGTDCEFYSTDCKFLNDHINRNILYTVQIVHLTPKKCSADHKNSYRLFY